MKQIHHVFMFILLSLTLVGCGPANGMVWAGRYHSPLNIYSVALPRAGLNVQDDGNNLGGRVSFYDDFGNLWAITYLSIDEFTESALGDHRQKEAAYREFLKTYAVPALFNQVSLNTRIVHEEFLIDGEDSVYFAVVSIPEGSVVLELKQNRRLDSVRGLFIFHKGDYMYMVESDMNSITRQVDPSSLTPGELESSQAALKRLKDSMVFK